jgi:hypothetical protein
MDAKLGYMRLPLACDTLIAELNDQLRQRRVGGRTMITSGVQALGAGRARRLQ